MINRNGILRNVIVGETLGLYKHEDHVFSSAGGFVHRLGISEILYRSVERSWGGDRGGGGGRRGGKNWILRSITWQIRSVYTNICPPVREIIHS